MSYISVGNFRTSSEKSTYKQSSKCLSVSEKSKQKLYDNGEITSNPEVKLFLP